MGLLQMLSTLQTPIVAIVGARKAMAKPMALPGEATRKDVPEAWLLVCALQGVHACGSQ